MSLPSTLTGSDTSILVPGDPQMGCFLACFGLDKSSKKRRRSSKRREGHGGYVPLDSGRGGNGIVLGSDDQIKMAASSKVKKRVRFNLDATVYGPIMDENDEISLYQSDGEEKAKWGSDSSGPCMRPQPSPANRYKNNRQDQEEEEEEEEELQFNENDWNSDCDENQDNFLSKLSPLAMESPDQIITDRAIDEDGFKSPELVLSKARDRAKYVFNVLNPVENLTQWKLLKSHPSC